jgi:hypothetical protein
LLGERNEDPVIEAVARIGRLTEIVEGLAAAAELEVRAASLARNSLKLSVFSRAVISAVLYSDQAAELSVIFIFLRKCRLAIRMAPCRDSLFNSSLGTILRDQARPSVYSMSNV